MVFKFFENLESKTYLAVNSVTCSNDFQIFIKRLDIMA